MKKWKRNNSVLLKTKIFFFTEKQRTNLISNDQRIHVPLVAAFIFFKKQNYSNLYTLTLNIKY